MNEIVNIYLYYISSYNLYVARHNYHKYTKLHLFGRYLLWWSNRILISHKWYFPLHLTLCMYMHLNQINRLRKEQNISISPGSATPSRGYEIIFGSCCSVFGYLRCVLYTNLKICLTFGHLTIYFGYGLSLNVPLTSSVSFSLYW